MDYIEHTYNSKTLVKKLKIIIYVLERYVYYVHKNKKNADNKKK